MVACSAGVGGAWLVSVSYSPMRPAVALLARDLEPSWSDPLVAALLGLRLPPPTDEDEDEEHPRRLLEGECRVIARRAQVPNNATTAAGDDISHEAVVEVASLRALELALTRNGATAVRVPRSHPEKMNRRTRGAPASKDGVRARELHSSHRRFRPDRLYVVRATVRRRCRSMKNVSNDVTRGLATRRDVTRDSPHAPCPCP